MATKIKRKEDKTTKILTLKHVECLCFPLRDQQLYITAIAVTGDCATKVQKEILSVL